MPAFYPSMVVKLKLRFDEALHVVSDPPAQTTGEAAANPPQGSGDPAMEPLVTRRGEQNATFILGRVPKKGDVELPGYRQAGTFSLTFDFKDLPIDPRTVRASAVEIHLGAVSPDDFATGMRRKEENGTRRSVLTPSDDNRLMVGLVDEWEVEHTDSGSEVTMKGRDMRGILLDSPLSSKRPNFETPASILQALDLSQTIDNVVRQIISFHPEGRQFTVAVNAAEWPGGQLPAGLPANVIPRHRKGARGQRAGGRSNVQGQADQMTYWDAIVRFCYLVGAIPYFDGTTLRVRPVRSIFDQERAGFDPSIPTPFRPDQPREVGGQQFSVRRMVYGRDVAKLSFSRKFAGNSKPKVIRCVATNLSRTDRTATTTVEAVWPQPTNTTGARRTRVDPSNQQAQAEMLTVPIAGINDPARLLEIAKNLYEEIVRNEMGGSFDTKNLASFGGDNQDPDLVRLRPGDGIEFYVDARALSSRAPLVSTLTDHEREPFETAVNRIKDRIGDENLARVIVATARGQVAEIQRFFRIANVKYGWAADSGVNISADFQNYFVQRAGVTGTVGTDAGSVSRTAVPAGRSF
jgi:hypothetical protein